MKNTSYIVWIGGVADYEGDNLNEAKKVYNSWNRLGYDDVILQTILDDDGLGFTENTERGQELYYAIEAELESYLKA